MINTRVAMTALIAAFAVPAYAADDIAFPDTAAQWSGYYVGVHGGHAWGNSNTTAVGESTQQIIDDLGNPGAYDTDPDGLFGGVQVGADRQFGNIVIGAEASLSYGDVSDTINDPYPVDSVQTIKTEIDWSGTVRGRLGFDLGGTLVYGTGGFAWANATSVLSGNSELGNESFTLTGWTAGAGIEHMVTENVSLRGEYLYKDFGTHTLYEDVHNGDYALDVDMASHSVAVGLNYRF